VDAALAAGRLVGDAGLGDAAADREGDQLFMALAPGAAVIALLEQRAGLVIGIGVDAREQAPELSPLETEMPFPPSTRGRTSRPEINRGFTANMPGAFGVPSCGVGVRDFAQGVCS